MILDAVMYFNEIKNLKILTGPHYFENKKHRKKNYLFEIKNAVDLKKYAFLKEKPAFLRENMRLQFLTNFFPQNTFKHCGQLINNENSLIINT